MPEAPVFFTPFQDAMSGRDFREGVERISVRHETAI